MVGVGQQIDVTGLAPGQYWLEAHVDPDNHLLIEERPTGEVVGTYRMQTAEMAEAGGYYSAGLFQVESLPEAVRRSAVEVGRACIGMPHRNGRVLRLLWQGLAGPRRPGRSREPSSNGRSRGMAAASLATGAAQNPAYRPSGPSFRRRRLSTTKNTKNTKSAKGSVIGPDVGAPPAPWCSSGLPGWA